MRFPRQADLNRARRRPPGERVLVYLDQSSLSRMLREPDAFGELRTLLLEEVRSGRVICVRSPAHDDESRLAREGTWREIDRLTRDLSPGVQFLSVGQIEHNEIRAAARELIGRSAEQLWLEAFTADPHTAGEPHVEIFGGSVTVRAVLPPTDLDRDEVAHEKGKEEALTDAYGEIRKSFSFEETCEANLHALLEWKLGPLASTSTWQALLERRGREAVEEWRHGANPLRPGSAFRKFQAVAQRGTFIAALIDELPELRGRAADFSASVELRTMPSLLLSAYLRAALAVTPGRRAKPGDAYDLVHLVSGLSRCDLVTADRGMVEVVRSRRLLPGGVRLFESSDVDGLITALRETLDSEL